MSKKLEAESIVDLLDLITHLSEHDPKSDTMLLAKVSEEHGEIARALLQRHGQRGREGKSEIEIMENIAEECCDTTIACLELALRYEGMATIKKLLLKKLARRMKGAKCPHPSW